MRKAAAMTDQQHPSESAPGDTGRTELIERSLLVLLVIGLFVGVLAVVRPFTTAILFGTSLATAAWPLRQALVRRGFRRGPTAAILLLVSLALIAFPLLAVAPTLAEQLNEGTQRLKSYFGASPAQPTWLAGLPIIGQRLVLGWQRLVESGGDLKTLSAPYANDIEQTIVAAARALGDSVLQVILSLVIATMFWTNGDALVAVLHEALRRLGGATAERTLDIAAAAIRGVAYGVVGTAALQSALLAIGLAVAGVPGAAMLGFVGLLLAISQIGAPLLILIWGGAAWWLFGQSQAWGVFMIAWGVFVGMIDNFIKPWLIGVGIQMPVSLTILGVFGGFLAFGFLGLFIGPTLIAVLFTLMQAWRADAQTDPPQA
jgi:predicted PurR-regulated permease PerM